MSNWHNPQTEDPHKTLLLAMNIRLATFADVHTQNHTQTYYWYSVKQTGLPESILKNNLISSVNCLALGSPFNCHIATRHNTLF